jgi:molybdopterin-guanine dinucleotide biosynthesis protein A
MMSTEIVAGVLIGGQSRRMGTCKALLTYQGITFLDRVVRAASCVGQEVVLLGNPNSETTDTLNPNLLRIDDEPDSGGPLAGLVPLLRHASERWALLTACDMPLLDAPILQRLIRVRDDSTDAVVFRVGETGTHHVPCCGLFHPRVLPTSQSTLAVGAGLRDFAQRIRTKYVDVNGAESHVLRGVNTPEELRHLIDNP